MGRRSSGETDRVRITPRLVRVADDRHVWADVLESDVTGLFELQDRIVQHVAEALDASVRTSGNQPTTPVRQP